MVMNILAKGTFAAAVVGVLLASAYGCDQPKAKCAAGRGSFIGVYKQTSGPPSCADLKGEKLGFSTYNVAGKEGKPNLDIANIAIESESLGTLVDTASGAGVTDKDDTHKPYATGFFSTAEPEGDFCRVPTLTVATQSIPAIPADPDNMVDATPATTVSYAWSNIKLYVTPAALGTQFDADLVLTTDNVACGYKVTGMYPYVDCSMPDPANKKKKLPDEGACAPEADEDAGRPTGSGINPDFPTHCDPDLLACTLTKDVLPALK